MLENMGKGSFSHLYVCSRCAPWCSGPTSVHIDLAMQWVVEKKERKGEIEEERLG